MTVTETSLPGVLLLEPKVFGDERGYFLEIWNQRTFEACGIPGPFVQDNQSFSRRGILRGLHYQVGNPQGKLVWAVQGEVLDIAVDLRRSSPHFGQWIAMRLSAENCLRAWIPPGFAHGFHVLSETAMVCYKCTEYYTPQNERILVYNDPDLAIDWMLDPGRPPILSARDQAGKRFRDAETYP
jgi:dTDP-4-dehydrorhamnose 3,5-epimerase